MSERVRPVRCGPAWDPLLTVRGSRGSWHGSHRRCFDEFYTANAGRLVGQVYAISGDLHEAEDAVQEAFARASLRWERIRGYDQPEAWVRRVAINLVRSEVRRAGRRLRALVRHLAVSRRSAPVAVGAGSVWVACCGPDKGRPVVHELRRIDLASNRVTAKITLPGQPDAVGAGPGGVWVRGSNGPVWRIDPTSNRVAATVQIPGNLGGDRGSVLVGPDDVWVSDPEHRVVYRIDARHDRLTAYRVDLRSPGLQAGLGRTDDGTVWTPATVPPPEEVRTRAERIVVLGLHPGKVVRTLAVPLRYGNDVVTLTAGSQTVWAATDMGDLLRFDL